MTEKIKVVRSPILEDQELPEIHTHDNIDQPAVDFSQVTGAAHSTLTGVTVDQHHARDHASRHAPGGGDALSLTSANMASIVTDETGSGLLVFATSPTLTTPVIGAATGTSLQLSGLTASQILATDASKNLQSLAVATYPSLTELSYVKGLTSAIQTQIDGKASTAHGASNHTDRDRTLFLPPRLFGATQGTPVLVTYGVTAADSAEAWAFDAAADESIGTAFEMPADWASGTGVIFRYIWAADTATSGDVLWYLTLTSIANDDDIDETYSTNPSGASTATATANRRITFIVTNAAGTNFAANSTVRIRVARLGSFAADTMTGDALLLGVRVTYTADM